MRKHAAAKPRRSTHIVTGEGLNPLAEWIAANNTGDTLGADRKISTRYWKLMRIQTVDNVDNLRPGGLASPNSCRCLWAAIHESFPAPKRLNKQNLR
jgi:hypothetical protein